MNEMEIWVDIPEYIGTYQTSNFGGVRSLDHEVASKGGSKRIYKGVSIKCFDDGSGYLYVNLCKKNTPKKMAVHRLVLIAFIGEAPDSFQACHNDGVRSNAKLSNLRWDSAANNCADKHKHGTAMIGEKSHQAVLTSKQVKDILSNPLSSKKMGVIYGVASSTIRAIRIKKNWKHIEVTP